MRLSHYEALKPCSAQLGRETRQLNNETNTRFLATSELVEQTLPRIRISVGDFSALQETSRARARERESEEGIFALVPVVRRARAIKPLWLETAVGRGCGAIVFARLFFDCDVVSGFLSWRRREAAKVKRYFRRFHGQEILGILRQRYAWPRNNGALLTVEHGFSFPFPS